MGTTDHDLRSPSEDGASTHVTRGVPGGTTRLPRLGSTPPRPGSAGGPPLEMVSSGFVEDELTRARRSRADRDTPTTGDGDGDEPVVLRFADYSPTESLFADDERVTAAADTEPDAPTTILGVAANADWNTIRAAHRKLLRELHPDRFVTSDERTRRDAADRLAAINIAYHELERTRRAV